MTDYLIDANVLIQAKNLHYGFDFCPGFWDWLVEQNRTGKVASIQKVADELHAGADELADWAVALTPPRAAHRHRQTSRNPPTDRGDSGCP